MRHSIISLALAAGVLLLPACQDKFYDTSLGDNQQAERETLTQGTAFAWTSPDVDGVFAVVCSFASDGVVLTTDPLTGQMSCSGDGYAFDLCFLTDAPALADGKYVTSDSLAPMTMDNSQAQVVVLHNNIATTLALQSVEADVKHDGDQVVIDINAVAITGANVHATYHAPLEVKDETILTEASAIVVGDIVGAGTSVGVVCSLISEDVIATYDEDADETIYGGNGLAFDLFLFSPDPAALADGTYQFDVTGDPNTIYPYWTQVSLLQNGVQTVLSLKALNVEVKNEGEQFLIGIEAITAAGATVAATYHAPLDVYVME
ncbi:MAG: hypothetical protein ACI4BD_05190 [Paludibacteraceae bacterium]